MSCGSSENATLLAAEAELDPVFVGVLASSAMIVPCCWRFVGIAVIVIAFSIIVPAMSLTIPTRLLISPLFLTRIFLRVE